MNPFLTNKPKAQRKAEMAESDNKVADTKKKSLSIKKRKSKTVGEEFDYDAYLGEDEAPVKSKRLVITEKKDSTEKPKKKKKKKKMDLPAWEEEVPKKKKKKKSTPKQDEAEFEDWEEPTSDYGDGPKKKKKVEGKKVAGKPKKADKEEDDWGIQVYEKPKSNIEKLSQVKSKKLRSILATNREELLQLVENDEVDTASAAIYKRMLQALVDVIGHTEHMIHKSKGARGTHQMNLLVGSIRDILLDLQQAQDRGMLAENLCTRFLAPSYLAIGMEILRENEMLFNRLKRELDKDSIDRYSKVFAEQEQRVGNFVQGQYVTMREEVKKFLQR